MPREMLAPGDVAISPDNDTCIVWNPMMPPEAREGVVHLRQAQQEVTPRPGDDEDLL